MTTPELEAAIRAAANIMSEGDKDRYMPEYDKRAERVLRAALTHLRDHPTEKQIEAVAIDIYKALPEIQDLKFIPWDDLPKYGHTKYRQEAIRGAAIAALRAYWGSVL